jgi:hypothetical protein
VNILIRLISQVRLLRAIRRTAAAIAFFILIFVALPSAHADNACCVITAINKKTGVVTAKETGKENASGRPFEFKVTDSRLLNSLRVGQGVYANFGAKQVSVDGKNPCCAIVSLGNVPTGAGMVPQSGQATPPPPQSSDPGKDKNKPGDKKTDASKTSLSSGTVLTPAENTTESAIRGATAADGQPKNDKGKVMLTHTAHPFIRIPQTQANAGNVINPNPNHLPDLFPNAVGGASVCMHPASESCEQGCPPSTAKVNLGVKNSTQYSASGTIHVVLQDMSGNTVRTWTVNSLAGNGEAYPGYYTYTIQWCSSGGSAGYVAVPPPNYVLLVKTPNGVADFDPNNNRAEIYIRPDATIAP